MEYNNHPILSKLDLLAIFSLSISLMEALQYTAIILSIVSILISIVYKLKNFKK